MQVFINQAIGIDQGEEALFSDFENGGAMWTGTGPRERRKQVTFRRAFKEVPMVHVALSLWDMDSATNARADIAAEQVTNTGFALVFRTWSDTRVARVRARWLAIGGAFHEDDWQNVY